MILDWMKAIWMEDKRRILMQTTKTLRMIHCLREFVTVLSTFEFYQQKWVNCVHTLNVSWKNYIVSDELHPTVCK